MFDQNDDNDRRTDEQDADRITPEASPSAGWRATYYVLGATPPDAEWTGGPRR